MTGDVPDESPVELTANIELPRCPQCRLPVAPGSRFCSSCGAALHGGETTTMPAVEESGPLPALSPEILAAVSSGHAVLWGHKGPADGSHYELAGSAPVRVGRTPDSELFLDDVTVSRRHAEFVPVDGGWRLVDHGSLNGSYVNRQRIDARQLVSGDEVQIGKYRFLYFEVPHSEAQGS